jgi:hypothetical protein
MAVARAHHSGMRGVAAVRVGSAIAAAADPWTDLRGARV